MPDRRPELFGAAFALFLERARAQKGLSQSALADRMKMARSSVSQWESSTFIPSEKTWSKLLPALGMSLGDALRGMGKAADDIAEKGEVAKGTRDALDRAAKRVPGGYVRRDGSDGDGK